MKKLLVVALLLLSMCSMTVNAKVIGNVASSGGPGSGGGSGSDGKVTIEGERDDIKVTVYLPDYTYYPKVTAIHSLNAELAKDEGVYFIPRLEDFPVNPADTASSLTDSQGKVHNFATVYDGYFNSEVEYVSVPGGTGVSHVTTSKKVYDSTDSSRALTLMGYDLLLSEESCEISAVGGNLNATYRATPVTTQPLTTKTVIMDLYKAVNQYEWDIQFAYCIDNTLKVTTSPVQEGLNLATNPAKGVNTAEGKTWVWATRTNPDLYWDRAMKDSIMNGGAHKATTSYKTAGTNTSVSFHKAETSTVTFGEFCALARAIMELYGEPVISDAERLDMIQNYGLYIPKSCNTEIQESMEYLAAKGIIDPTVMNIDKAVTFSDIEIILCRIRDKDSRLSFKKTDYDISTNMYESGYIRTSAVVREDSVLNVSEVAEPQHTSEGYYDYFIQSTDEYTNFILKEDCALGKAGTLVADNITAMPYPTTAPSESTGGAVDCIYKGITDTGYYHLKIRKDMSAVSIVYADFQYIDYLNKWYYEIPAGGGVYDVANGNITQYSFDEKGYSQLYLDADRNAKPSQLDAPLGLDEFHWYQIAVEYTDETSLQNTVSTFTYHGQQLNLQNLAENEQAQLVSENMPNTQWWRGKDLVDDTTGVKTAIYYCQTLDSESVFQSNVVATGSSSNELSDCYYKYGDSNTILVSVNNLMSSNLATSVSELPKGNGIVITSTSLYGNVYLFSDTNRILVGSTLYNLGSDETLYVKDNDKYYVNYRACIGWTSNKLSMVYCPETKAVQVGNDLNCQTGTTIKGNLPSVTVKTFYPNASQNAGGYRNPKYTSGVSMSGLRMASSYPLSNYLIVINELNDADSLYVVKHRYFNDTKGNAVTMPDDSNIRQNFLQATGIDLNQIDVNGRYYLEYHTLPRKTGYTDDGGTFLFEQYYNNTAQSTKPVATIGWVYYPAISDDLTDSMQKYCTGDIAMPIVNLEGQWCNVNLNICAKNATAEKEPYGSLPYRFQYTYRKQNQCMGSLDDKGNVTQGKTADLHSLIVYPAPAGWFTGLLGGVQSTVSDLKSASPIIYLGTSKCTMKSTSEAQVYLNDLLVGDEQLNTTCAYIPSSSNAVYTVTDESVGVNMAGGSSNNILAAFFDAKQMVDWDAYTFRRVIETADLWSSITIILALNVLPRFFMALYFLLILLSLIADVPMWRKFNVNVFDVYKLLTFGRVSVGTVDKKRLALQSIAAFSVFFMLCDGVLWNFIMWVAKFILVLQQR